MDIYYNLDGANGGENAITTVYNEIYAITEYFDDLGRLIQQTESPIDGNETVLSKYYYDGHRVSEVYDSKNNYAVYGYDPFDRVISLVQQDNEDNILGQYSVIFDDYNLTRTVNNAGKINKTYYDKHGRLIRTDIQTGTGLASSYTYYDYMGNANRIKTPKDEEAEYLYNNRGLLTKATDPINRETDYTYDAFGNVLTVTSAGLKITENTYDRLNRLLTSTDAMGMVSYYAYDAAGQVLASKDRNEYITTYEYKPIPNTNLYTSYLEKQIKGDSELSYTYDEFGNVLTATKGTGADAETTKYTYKYNNLLETVTTMFGTDDARTLTYGYDANKNVNSVEDYFGAVTSYTHDGLNRPKTVTRNNAPVASYDYYQFGALEKIIYPGQGRSEFFYDNALRLTGQTNKLADNTVVNAYLYQYDLNGNQTQKTDNGLITSYGYDDLGRLEYVSEPDGTQTTYRFDEQSNISNKKIIHPTSYEFKFEKNGLDYSMSNVVTHEVNYAYDKNNRLKFEGEYVGGAGELFAGFLEIEKFNEYDNNGNLLSTKTDGQIDESMVEYTYNPLNQLTQFKGADGAVTNYAYNPDGMRRSKTANGVTTQFYWDRGYISNESISGVITASNYIGIQGIFARETSDGTSYMLKNGHGDVVKLVSGGVETLSYDFDAYGVEKGAVDGDTNPFRYCGEYTDLSSGLIYLRNRYYDPSVGRFISEDPIRAGENWYVYCLNNPVNRIDPLGLDSYIFYVMGDAVEKGKTTLDEANVWKEKMEKEYKTKALTIEIKSLEQFDELWDALSGISDVDGVVIISHGHIADDNGSGVGYAIMPGGRLYARNWEGKKSTDRSTDDLNSVTMKELVFSVCNSANPDVYNLAYGFKINNSITGNITGWDGGTVFNFKKKDNVRGGGKNHFWQTWQDEQNSQSGYWRWVPKNDKGIPTRDRIGKRVIPGQ